ncbi:PhnD/SsuA/transferrin family substrate-binding protein [Oscillatoria sp. CS-180]|uniref:phosphate/phosphite/phosphonate ABC transporter substrate-binding protein n=1 Tax=Oscillatoria sp. CS-180 TaxID=3021720 RepID=UPI002330F4E0|nr:PhnD/SsuA/transferrin family substrate-binding protein [Oscillatoria sp. CS-180]MDB9525320.1 PhnD/SsuA/transferrin family substrate-binding protein [Oscillatoria sp. CS-180]
MQRLRRLFALLCLGFCLVLLLHIGGCDRVSTPSANYTRLTVGLVVYDASIEPYNPFRQYLEEALKATVELEPVFNEIRAVEQIQAQAWEIVLAPAGLAAIAIAEAQYVPLFPLQGTPNQRSVLVVKEDSPLEDLNDLTDTVIALGEPGSATGYYLPLYDLYGLTLAEVRFAPTPKTVLEWLENNEIAAGALSEQDFQRHRNSFSSTRFRVLHQSRITTGGAVLISPKVERNQQRLIEEAMKAAPASIMSDAGYIANSPVPKFDQLIQLVQKVQPLEERVKEQPAILILEKSDE